MFSLDSKLERSLILLAFKEFVVMLEPSKPQNNQLVFCSIYSKSFQAEIGLRSDLCQLGALRQCHKNATRDDQISEYWLSDYSLRLIFFAF